MDDFSTSVVSNSLISNFTFNQSMNAITFNVTGATGTSAFCNITFPIQLLGGPYTVLVDSFPVTPIVTSNATHTSLYLAYTHSAHTVEIIGETVIPEFPTLISTMLLLTMLATVILYVKRKTSSLNLSH